MSFYDNLENDLLPSSIISSSGKQQQPQQHQPSSTNYCPKLKSSFFTNSSLNLLYQLGSFKSQMGNQSTAPSKVFSNNKRKPISIPPTSPNTSLFYDTEYDAVTPNGVNKFNFSPNISPKEDLSDVVSLNHNNDDNSFSSFSSCKSCFLETRLDALIKSNFKNSCSSHLDCTNSENRSGAISQPTAVPCTFSQQEDENNNNCHDITNNSQQIIHHIKDQISPVCSKDTIQSNHPVMRQEEYFSRRKSHRINYAIDELLQTEKNYVNSIGIIVNYSLYFKSLNFDSEILEKFKIIFCNIEEIYSLHQNFFLELCKKQKNLLSLCDTFFAHLKTFENLYSEYCLNLNRALSQFQEISSSSPLHSPFYGEGFGDLRYCEDSCDLRRGSLVQLLEIRKDALKHVLPLDAFLVKPMQRLLKYPLIISNISSSIEALELGQSEKFAYISKLQSLKSLLNKIIFNINHEKERMESKEKVIRLLSQITQLPNCISNRLEPQQQLGDLLFEDDKVIENNRSSVKRRFILFQKCLLIVKRVNNTCPLLFSYARHFWISSITSISYLPTKSLSFLFKESIESSPPSFQNSSASGPPSSAELPLQIFLTYTFSTKKIFFDLVKNLESCGFEISELNLNTKKSLSSFSTSSSSSSSSSCSSSALFTSCRNSSLNLKIFEPIKSLQKILKSTYIFSSGGSNNHGNPKKDPTATSNDILTSSDSSSKWFLSSSKSSIPSCFPSPNSSGLMHAKQNGKTSYKFRSTHQLNASLKIFQPKFDLTRKTSV